MDTKGQQTKVDPGWNDPPMLNYSPTNPPPKSRITNKRVAFPLASNSPVSNSPPVTQTLQCPSFPFSINETVLMDMKAILEKYSAKEEDIQQFCKSWEANKTPDFQMNIHMLLEYISNSDKNGVEKVKLKLSTEYKSACESWLHYIKL